MKRLLRIILLLTALGTLASCGGSSPSGTTSASTTVGSTAPVHTTRDTTPIFPEVTPMESFETYQNPLLDYRDENAWEGYGFGDPFVMRFNGIYYLYVSTLDGQVGIRCWSSPDLINWSYEGYCATDERTRGAYAPEVFYYNGFFYMYTSPAGNGHYVLKSSSPTEGFEVISGNLGMSIDGSVFIDNDGSWYFYTAGSGNLRVYDMTSPSTMETERVISAASVNGGWTEGPMVVYHDGYYYITYTGNHVLSPSYRICYAVSESTPTKFKRVEDNNPLLISTSEEVHGIGHSSTVKGPNLDSYYIVYHALLDLKPNRTMNIDRIVFNGDRMEITGPTVTPQQAPALPDLYDRFPTDPSDGVWTVKGSAVSDGDGLRLSEGSMLLSKKTFEGDFTAEYNVTSISANARAGAVFGYTDSENYGTCCFDPASGKVVIEITIGGTVTKTEVSTVRSFGEDTRFDCLQSLQIERCGNDYTFYMNDRLLCTLENVGLGGGSVGYAAFGGEASFGFIGATAAVGGNSGSEQFKTISDRGGFIPAYEAIESLPTLTAENGRRYISASEGDILSYRVLASAEGNYDLSLLFNGPASAIAEVYADGVSVGSLALSDTEGKSATAVGRSISLSQGAHVISLRLLGGSVGIESLLMRRGTPVTEIGLDRPLYIDGDWSATDEGLSISGIAPCGKAIFGSYNWGDYEVELTVTASSAPDCGVLVRVTDPGSPAFLNQPNDSYSPYWLEGYGISLSTSDISLSKHSYGNDTLARAERVFSENTPYLLKVVCRGADIEVYIDGELMLKYTDPDPFMQGAVGLRTQFCSAAFDGITVRP